MLPYSFPSTMESSKDATGFGPAGAEKACLPGGISGPLECLLTFAIVGVTSSAFRQIPFRVERQSSGTTSRVASSRAINAAQLGHTAVEVRAILPVGERMVRNLLTQWVNDGFLVIRNSSNRARSYGLSAKSRKFMTPF